MSQTLIGRSSVQHVIDALTGGNPRWGQIAQTPVALDFGDPEAEKQAAAELALCDLSALPKTGVKGPAAAAWLTSQQIDVPGQTYETRDLADGGVIAKISANEFVLESGIADQTVKAINEQLGEARGGAYHTEQQLTTFFLAGSRALEVMAQTCGIDFQTAEQRRLIYSRIAGVSAAILPDWVNQLPVYRMWIDYSYGPALWQTLSGIASELGGQVVGGLCLPATGRGPVAEESPPTSVIRK